MRNKKARILVVDDLPDWRAVLSALLTDEGYEVWSASSRYEALRIIDAEYLDLAILDVRLDEADEDNRDGLSLMREIKGKNPTIAIIILTGYASVKMVREALEPNQNGISSALDFVEKSEIEMLIESVRRALDR